MTKLKPKKRRGVLESFLNSGFDDKMLQDASRLVEEVTNPVNISDITGKYIKNEKGTPKEQYRNNIGTPKEHHRNTIGTPKEHHRNTIGTPSKKLDVSDIERKSIKNEGTPKEHHRNTIGTPSKKSHDNKTITSSEEHHRNNIGTPKEHHRNTIGTPKEHDKKIAKKTKTTSKKEHHRNTSIRLPAKQFDVYNWLKSNGVNSSFNKALILKETGIAYMTIRKAIWKLESSNIISLNYDRSLKEFEYKLNTNVNVEGPKKDIIKTKKEHHRNTIGTPKEHDRNTIGTPSLSSSSLLLKNNTTSKASEILETEIELGYWRQKNLSPKQFLSWLKLFNDDVDLLIESLSYCAFAMVDLNEEKEKPVRNVFSWFFKIVEKTGSYPKPKGYKSCRQKLIENKERVLKEKKDEIERLEKLTKEESELNQELEYQKILQNKEGEDYKWCFNRLNDFTKKLPENHSVFRTLMKKAFEDLQIVKQIREILKDKNKENQELIEKYKINYPELVELVLNEKTEQ